MISTGDAPAASPPAPPNHLTGAILATIFCCMPLGIVAIVFAAQVNGKLASGDYPGAVATSQMAGRLFRIAFYVGLAEKVLLLVALIVSVALYVYFQSAATPPGVH